MAATETESTTGPFIKADLEESANGNYTQAETSSLHASLHPRAQFIAEGFHNRTKGEAFFNKLSYIGVGYFLVTGVSVLMTWLMNDEAHIAPRFKGVKEVLARVKLPPTLTQIGTLFLGGTIASVLPVKWMEDRKPEWVKIFDHYYYTQEQIDHDPNIIAAHRELDSMPKQTWLSVFGSRVVAFAATLSVYFLMGNNKGPFARATGQSLDKLSIEAGRAIDQATHFFNPAVKAEINLIKAENELRIGLPNGAPDKLFGPEILRHGPHPDRVASKVWSYISLDAFYTIITSAALFVFTRVFGGLWGKAAPASPVAPLEGKAAPSGAVADIIPSAAPVQAEKKDIPATHIRQPVYEKPLHTPASDHHLTA